MTPAINEDVRAAAQRREISRLCHFTRVSALASIIETDGLWSRTALGTLEIDCQPNDPVRYDGHLDYISCSVQYPNVSVLREFMARIPVDWVIILMAPDPLSWESTRFCPVNAAKGKGADIDDGYPAFERLFAPHIKPEWPRQRSIYQPPCCPTYIQAEALILEHIPLTLFRSLIFRDQTGGERARSMLCLDESLPDVALQVSDTLFSPQLEETVRSGLTPQHPTAIADREERDGI